MIRYIYFTIIAITSFIYEKITKIIRYIIAAYTYHLINIFKIIISIFLAVIHISIAFVYS